MRGYVAYHRSHPYDGIRADYYRNDPYVWFSPYLWSFCHLNQRPRIEIGMKVLWLSKVDETYVCDLVFIVEEILPFQEALARFQDQDVDLAQRHFAQGMKYHKEVNRPDAKTYVADMGRSYIPHPAVHLEREVDELRRREWALAKPLAVAWRRPSSPLRIEAIDSLEAIVRERAPERISGPLGADGWSPGQEDSLR